MSWHTLVGALEQGFVFGLMSIGVYLTFRVLDFPDLSVDGTLPLGAAVSATVIHAGWSPWFSLVIAVAAGMIAGALTGIMSTKLRILNLLAGILTMIALYSVNIRIMGAPNLTLLNRPTIFDSFAGLGLPSFVVPMIVAAVMGFLLMTGLDAFLHTNFGLALRATGDNPRMVTAQGFNPHAAIIVGVALSNGFVALSGALLAQSQGSADVGMGVGTIIAGLAAVIIGEAFVGRRSVLVALVSVMMGSLVYRLVIAAALTFRWGPLSLTPSDLNLITAMLVMAALAFPHVKGRLVPKRIDH